MHAGRAGFVLDLESRTRNAAVSRTHLYCAFLLRAVIYSTGWLRRGLIACERGASRKRPLSIP